MESLFLLAFGEEEFLAALAMTGSEAFFNKLLGMKVCVTRNYHPDDQMSTEEPGNIVRVDILRGDRKGIAIRILGKG